MATYKKKTKLTSRGVAKKMAKAHKAKADTKKSMKTGLRHLRPRPAGKPLSLWDQELKARDEYDDRTRKLISDQKYKNLYGKPKPKPKPKPVPLPQPKIGFLTKRKKSAKKKKRKYA